MLQGDRLMVPWRVHKQVAVLVVETYQRFVHGKHLGSMIMEGVKQVGLSITAVIIQDDLLQITCLTLTMLFRETPSILLNLELSVYNVNAAAMTSFELICIGSLLHHILACYINPSGHLVPDGNFHYKGLREETSSCLSDGLTAIDCPYFLHVFSTLPV